MPKPSLWTDPKTGKQHYVQFPGADKGFANNPFKEWAKNGGTQGMPKIPVRQPDEVEKAVGVVKGAAKDLQEACVKANPDYSKSRNFKINCQRCVPTFELRRRGYPVAALPNDFNVPNKSGICNGNECWQNSTIKGYYGNRATKLTKADLLKELKAHPDGARFGIIWVWPNGQDAHTIACEKVNGRLIFLDPQNGQIGSTTLGSAHRKYGYSYYRMDDKNFEPGFQWDDIARPE